MADNKYVVNIKGKDYLTVAGRVNLAHESGRLLSVSMLPVGRYDEPGEDRDYITMIAKVRVLNEKNLPLVEKLVKAAGSENNWAVANTIQALLISEYEGIAKSPKEGSEAWNKLPFNSPERTNPTEVCSTSALGRALGAAGFGDTESFASADEVSIAQSRQDAYSEPLRSAVTTTRATSSANGTAARPVRTASATNPPTDKQKRFIQTLAKQKLNVQTPDEFAALVTTRFGKPIDSLSSKDVSEWIDELNKGIVPAAEEVPF